MQQSKTTNPLIQSFARDVSEGLKATPKYLPSRYFYDAQGDRLFQKIMAMPEYYLTRAEYEIFEGQSEAILQAIQPKGKINLVELGAGDGYKTKVLLRHMLQEKVDFTYYPVDISQNVLDILRKDLSQSLPQLAVHGLNCEYFEALKQLDHLDDSPRVLLFLGGNIGNFTAERARRFYSELSAHLRPGDRILSGIDLKKDPRVILRAYNDEAGITRAFNLNLLERINRELGGDFRLENFEHFPNYDPVSGECRSYLISKVDQEVQIEALNQKFYFARSEPIHTEISKKYSRAEIEELAVNTGFRAARHFVDQREYFVDSLWEKA